MAEVAAEDSSDDYNDNNSQREAYPPFVTICDSTKARLVGVHSSVRKDRSMNSKARREERIRTQPRHRARLCLSDPR